MQHLQPNTTLQGGKYRIERKLGQGGFGIAYLASQISLGRQVAIKEFFMKELCSRDKKGMTMLTTSGGSNQVEQYRKKFIKEAGNLAKLSHPNIISVIDVFEENDTVYYVMPYLAGGSLQSYVEKHGPLSEDEAMKYIRQIASALKYMHKEKHICHYDVKPTNILLDDNGNAVLIDFGISKNYDEAGNETTTTPVGMSEGYAPIEQYEQSVDKFSPSSDVYALGATLLFAMTGKRPPSAIERVNSASLDYPSCSSSIKDIIVSSMIIRKSNRAQSVDVFFNGKTRGSDSIDERTITSIRTVSLSNHDSISPAFPDPDPDQSPGYIRIFLPILLGIVFVAAIAIWAWKKLSVKEVPLLVKTEAVAEKKDIALKGRIGSDIYFSMHLFINGNEVEGIEHYDKNKSNSILRIKGRIENDLMTLYEYENNLEKGVFSGNISPSSYSGTFTNIKGKKYSFTASVDGDNSNTTEDNQEQFSTSLQTSYQERATYQEPTSNVSGNERNNNYVTSNSVDESNNYYRNNGENNVTQTEIVYDLSTSQGCYKKAKEMRMKGEGKKAIDLYLKANRIGESPYRLWALHQIGCIYYMGLGGIKSNYYEAFRYFKMASDLGLSPSTYYLGVCYEYGRGVTKDMNMAKQCYTKSGYDRVPNNDF